MTVLHFDQAKIGYLLSFIFEIAAIIMSKMVSLFMRSTTVMTSFFFRFFS